MTKKDCETIKLIPHVATTESSGLPYKYRIMNFSNIKPKIIVTITPNAIAIGNGKLKTFPETTVPYAPTVINSPCARLIIFIIPKITANPIAAKSKNASESPN